MTAFTSKATGNSNASGATTWNESGIPGDGDTISIADGHVVTVPSGVTLTVGTSGASGTTAITINGQGRLVNNGTLVCRGDMVLASTTTTAVLDFYQYECGPGAIHEWDSSQASDPTNQHYMCYPNASNRPNATWKMSGTANGGDAANKIPSTTGGNHVTVRSNASGGVGSFSTNGRNTRAGMGRATYTDFTDIGDDVVYGFECWLSFTDVVVDYFDIQYCTFTNCGLIYSRSAAGADTIFRFLRCRFASSAYPWVMLHNGANGPPTGAGEWSIKGCSVDSICTLQVPSGFVIGDQSDESLGNYFHIPPALSGAGYVVAYQRFNLLRLTANTPHYAGDLRANYIFYDDPGAGNPDAMQANEDLPAGTYDNTRNIFEINSPGTGTGDMFNPPAAASSAVVFDASYSLVLPTVDYPTPGWAPSGKLFGALGTANQTWIFDHFTVPCGGDGPIYIGDAYNPHTGFIASLRSGICWDDTVRRPVLYNRHDGGSDNGNVVDPANCDYNNNFNCKTSGDGGAVGTGTAAGTVYICAMSGSTPGTHDTALDPRFFDPTRRLRTWGSVRQATDGTDATALASLQADPTLIADLRSWVSDGWRTTNSALHNTGHDGADRGAAGFVAPGAPIAVIGGSMHGNLQGGFINA